ncbi:hypothetical protein BCR36DRAFT_408711 [Piromyces finnis]|uniref:CBM1 domain-containing protein n=1 Tax=Piromyces finnis TaxID=1754191 RepID=A0A1Y1VL95_9FUNG|nr:hypothetical protein BCR36DRAFT_408711 [Piromyces finnis]|eukprot:ORX59192.1 hypothetical protein BCR36DRAFT_408711 [Piromyces finnis]
MIRFIVLILFIISYVYADFVCWSRKLGYPCCSEGALVVNVDENGKWGIDKDNWCGILEPEVSSTTTKKASTTTTTKSNITKTTTTTATTTTKITTTKKTTTKKTTTTTTIKSTTKPSSTTTSQPVPTDDCPVLNIGYKCCTDPNAEVVVLDKNGEWSLEKNPETGEYEWCNIRKSNVKTTKTSKTTTTTTTVKSTTKPSSTTTSQPVPTDDCPVLNIGYKCCTDPNAEVVALDKNGEWSLERNPETGEYEWCNIRKSNVKTTKTSKTITTTTTVKSTTKSTTKTTTKTTTTTTNKPEPTSCVDDYDQCGGIGYSGPTCCKSGNSKCVSWSDYYAQCVPN